MNEGNSEAQQLPPMVPMPPGDNIIISDPFIDDFVLAQSSSNSTRIQQYQQQMSGGSTYGAAGQSYPAPPSYNSCPPNYYANCGPPLHPSCMHPSVGVMQHQQQPQIPMGALGRLFPGDQSVIVQNAASPTHPYIPPVFPCGLCRREILDNVQAVQCYLGCKFWFHRTCVGISEETFQILLKDPYAEWMCDPCYESKKETVDDGQYKIIHSRSN